MELDELDDITVACQVRVKENMTIPCAAPAVWTLQIRCPDCGPIPIVNTVCQDCRTLVQRLEDVVCGRCSNHALVYVWDVL